MEQQLTCPNCHAINMPSVMTCYICHSKLHGLPTEPFETEPSEDANLGRAYYFTIGGILLALVCYILPWLNAAPRNLGDRPNAATSALSILFGAQGSGAVIQTGINEDSVSGFDVQLVILILLIAEVVALIAAFSKPTFAPLLRCGLLMLAIPLYFFIQLLVRNPASSISVDSTSSLGLGFYGTIIGAVCLLGSIFFYGGDISIEFPNRDKTD